tara:strand:+ start:258583 stop:259482 length:900 start_codon:yes stop_codon:yes gene_type:complete
MQNYSFTDNKKKFVTGCLLLISIWLSPLQAKSKDEKTEPLYQVELIIFEHLDKSGLQEAWPLEPGKPNVYHAQSLSTLNDNKQEAPEIGTAELNASEFGMAENENSNNDQNNIEQTADATIQISEATQLQLEDAKARIKAKGSYRIIAHKAWIQPVLNKKEAITVRLAAGKTYAQKTSSYSENNYDVDEYGYKDENSMAPNPSELLEIDGTIKLIRGRYFHVDTDLIFTKPMRVLTPASGASSAVKLTNVRNRNNWERESNSRLQPFRLKRLVRIRKNEVQYLDHPMYGVLVTLTSIEN